mgnify:CR=1 FL=1
MNEKVLNTIIGAVKNNVKRCCDNNEDFIPVGLIIKDENITSVCSMLFRSTEEKIEAYKKLGYHCAEEGSYQIGFAVDCKYRPIRKEDADYTRDNWDTEKPSTYPLSMQKHAVLLKIINFKDSDEVYWMPYSIDSGKPVFDETEKIPIPQDDEYRRYFSDGFMDKIVRSREVEGDMNDFFNSIANEFPNVAEERNL